MRIAVAGGTGTVGRHVVAALEANGHEAVSLARSTGVDVITGVGLADAVAGAAAVVDVTSVSSASAASSVKFFGASTRMLLDAERKAGVPHHVALSIVGAAQINAGYYAGKRVQEDLVTASGMGWTILRATQFHEFAAQLVGSTGVGPFNFVPMARSQPIAAAEVGTALAELAVGEPRGLARDLAGPGVLTMASMLRRYLAAVGQRRPVIEFPLPGRWGRSMRRGMILPGPDAQLGTQTFDEWLATR